MRSEGLRITIVGIVGITAGNTQEVIRAGADGVSVITAITHADDERAAAAVLRLAVEQGLRLRTEGEGQT